MRLLVFYLLVCNNCFAQFNMELGGNIGLGYVKTTYQDKFFPASKIKENIYSSSSFVWQVSSTLSHKSSDYVTPLVSLSLGADAYNYKVSDYLDQGTIRASFTRIHTSLSVGARFFIFRKISKEQSQKGRYPKRNRKLISKPLSYLLAEYVIGLKISDNYQYASENLLPSEGKSNNTLHGYNLGFGIKKARFNYYLIYNSKFTNLLKNTRIDYNLRRVCIGLYYNLSDKVF